MKATFVPNRIAGQAAAGDLDRPRPICETPAMIAGSDLDAERQLPTSRPDAAGGSRFQVRLAALAVSLLCLGGLALAVDLPVARWCKSERLPREAMRLLNFSEAFAHGTGAAALLVVVLVIDPRLQLPRLGRNSLAPGARDFLRIIAATFTGGLLVDGVKALVERVRPRAADLASVATAFDTFGSAARLPQSTSHSDVTSFPSGHAAVAAGFAAALAWRYPRAAALFAVIGLLAATQRVVSSAHYPSDVACGAAIGLIGAAWFLGGGHGPAMEPASDS
jgi:membrane-associated phospholipid phosphatase